MSQACVVPACGRPTEAFLCSGCTVELVTALRELAFAVTRANASTIPDRLLGRRRPGLAVDLQDVMVRLVATANNSGVNSRAATTPLPFHEKAAELHHLMQNSLSTWARDLAESNPHLQASYVTITTVPAAAEWLATFPNLLALHPAAGEIHRDITSLTDRVRYLVDRAPDKIYLGRCGNEESEVPCENDLYAIHGRDVVYCPVCGAAWEVQARKEWLLTYVEDELATATDISRALSTLGRPVSENTIRTWAGRGQLTKKPAHPLDPRKRARYRVGDVVDLVAATARKQAS